MATNSWKPLPKQERKNVSWVYEHVLREENENGDIRIVCNVAKCDWKLVVAARAGTRNTATHLLATHGIIQLKSENEQTEASETADNAKSLARPADSGFRTSLRNLE